ncbi:MAG: hypothetical protein ACXVBE_11570 [Bdellovibrionota bacterium]
MISPRKLFYSVLVAFLILTPFTLVLRAESSVPSVLDLSTPKTTIELSFAQGQAYLDPFARQALDQMVREANLRGIIDQVQLFAWGDMQDPSAKDQIDLAASRARAVEEYLDSRGYGLSTRTTNMAEKPDSDQPAKLSRVVVSLITK